MTARHQPWRATLAFTKKDNSLFSLLERAFVEVFYAWAERINLGLGRPNAPLSVVNAADQLLEQILIHGKGYEGNPQDYSKDRELFVRSGVQWENSWATAAGSRFRRVAQEVLQSQTNVDRYEAARHVAILGAGASFHAGLPLTSEITSRVFTELDQRKPQTYKEIERVIKEIPSRDFEEILGLLQTLAWSKRAYRQSLPEEDDWVNQLVVSYKNVLLKAQFDRQGQQTTRRFLEKVEAESSGTWAIISFNQDTSVEHELEDMGIWSRNNGFGAIAIGDVNSSLPDRRVYKPHGSVAIHRPYAWPMRGARLDDRAFKRNSSTNRQVELADEAFAPFILAPSFLKIYVDDALTNAVARIIFELLAARHILVVGFRLRPDDLLIATMIRYALRANIEGDLPNDKRSFKLVGPSARDFSNQDSLGCAWASVIADLAAKGWAINLQPVTFEEYVTKSSTIF